MLASVVVVVGKLVVEEGMFYALSFSWLNFELVMADRVVLFWKSITLLASIIQNTETYGVSCRNYLVAIFQPYADNPIKVTSEQEVPILSSRHLSPIAFKGSFSCHNDQILMPTFSVCPSGFRLNGLLSTLNVEQPHPSRGKQIINCILKDVYILLCFTNWFWFGALLCCVDLDSSLDQIPTTSFVCVSVISTMTENNDPVAARKRRKEIMQSLRADKKEEAAAAAASEAEALPPKKRKVNKKQAAAAAAEPAPPPPPEAPPAEVDDPAEDADEEGEDNPNNMETATDDPSSDDGKMGADGKKKTQIRYDPEVPMNKDQLAAWRREARRVRNRESAAASRQRIRDRITELEVEVDEWKDKHAAALDRLAQLERLANGEDV
jgi:hypothetical protein